MHKQRLEIDTWADGCVQLAPDSSGYQLNGMCCAYLIIPKIKLNENRQFSTNANYYAFTGAGFAPNPTEIAGQLSPDGRMLTITYSVGSTTRTLRMRPGPATVTCDCFCN